MAETRDYARFYFDDVKNGLDTVLAEDLPAHTETSDRDALNVMKRMLAYVAHTFAAKLDVVAAEGSAATADRRPSWVSLGRLNGYVLTADSPGVVDVLMDVQGAPGAGDVMVPALSVFSTGGDAENAAVQYEYQGDAVAPGTLVFTLVPFDSPVFGAPVVGTLGAAPYVTPPVVGDALYIGHPVLQFDAVVLDYGVTPPSAYNQSFEYYDGYHRSVVPVSVTVLGADLIVDVTPFGPTSTSTAGLTVRVTYLGNGEFGDAVATGGGLSSLATIIGHLGQSTPSTNAGDYRVTALWVPLTGTSRTTPSDPETVSWTLPQGADNRWQITTVNGRSGYWVRDRALTAGGVAPSDVTVTAAPTNTWALLVAATQGRTVEDAVGTSDGTATQIFPLSHVPFVEGSVSVIDVAGDDDWVTTPTLFESDADDKHVELREEPDGTRNLVFGDGTNGAIPPGGSAIVVTYRVGADADGNVGTGAVTTAEANLSSLVNVRNPRPASGWREREGNTSAGIELLRIRVPGAARARTRAVSPDDAAWLAVVGPGLGGFATADGRTPMQRAIAVEGGAGPKSVRVVVVGANDTVPAAADVAELDVFYNGVTTGLQRFGGVAMANQRYSPVAYLPNPLALAVTVTVAARFAATTQVAVEAVLRAGFSPTAQTSDGHYRWTVAQTINERAGVLIVAEAGIPAVDVVFTSPAFPIVLGPVELPTVGSVAVTVVEV